MAPRVNKTISKDSNPIETAPLAVDQRKKTEERYRLQVDRQTKMSSTTLEAAVAAGALIKKAYPIVQVSIYDTVEAVNRMVGPDGIIEKTETARAE